MDCKAGCGLRQAPEEPPAGASISLSDAGESLDGRICLLYSLFWGILGVLWIKSLYPRVAQVILKIPNRFGKVLTWVLTIFMVFDCAMSLLAVDRWSERVRGETPVSAVDVFFDEHFPDSRMERIYANMEFGTNPA